MGARSSLVVAFTILGSSCAPGPLDPDVGLKPVEVPSPFRDDVPCLVVTPSGLGLPTAVAGCSASSAALTVRNRCDVGLRVTGVAQASPFGVSSGPVVLGPGAIASMTVRFVPTQAGAASARLVLRAQVGPHQQDTSFDVSAEATPTRRVSLEQEPTAALVSALFVVDDRGTATRRGEVDALARLLEAEYRLGALVRLEVVVSDLTGVLQSPEGVTVLDSRDPAFRRRFTQAMEPLPREGVHSCFETARRLRAERRPVGFWSGPFPPQVVCLTTRLDDSPAPASEMVGEFQGRGAQWPSFSLVAPFPVRSSPSMESSCEGDVDGRLAFLADATGGVRESLCVSWSSAFSAISRGLPPGPTVWLGPPGVARAESVRVSVNGVLLPSTDVRGSRVWRYQTTPPAIIIEPLYAPAPGGRLRVSWETCDL
jgi:hypothetical protein